MPLTSLFQEMHRFLVPLWGGERWESNRKNSWRHLLYGLQCSAGKAGFASWINVSSDSLSRGSPTHSVAALHSATLFSQTTETRTLLQFKPKEHKTKHGREPKEMHLFGVNYSIKIPFKILARSVTYKFSGINCRLLKSLFYSNRLVKRHCILQTSYRIATHARSLAWRLFRVSISK